MTARKFLNNASIYFLGQLLNRGLGFFLLPIYTRFLTVSDYGILSVAGTLTLIFGMLAGLSLDAATIILYFKLSEEDFKNLLFNILLALILIPLVFLVLLEIAGATIAADIFPDVPWHPYLSLAIWTAYFGIFPALLMGLLRAKQLAARYTIVNVVMFVLQTSLIMFFVIGLRGGAAGSLRGQVIAAGIAAIVSNIILLKLCRPWRLFGANKEHLSMALVLGLGYVPHIFSMWLLNVSDRWILSYFVSTADIGIYSLAYTIGMLVHLVGTATISAFSPIFFKSADDPEFRANLRRLLSGYVMLHTGTALSISLFATELLRIMTHTDFHRAAFYVPFIAIGYWFFVTIYQICFVVIENERRTGLTLYLTVPAALSGVIFKLLFVPQYGILAASVGTLVAFMLLAVLAVIITGRLDRMPFPWLKIMQVFGLAVLTFCVGNALLSFESLPTAITAKLALFSITFLLIAKITGFNIGDVKRILRTPTKVVI